MTNMTKENSQLPTKWRNRNYSTSLIMNELNHEMIDMETK